MAMCQGFVTDSSRTFAALNLLAFGFGLEGFVHGLKTPFGRSENAANEGDQQAGEFLRLREAGTNAIFQDREAVVTREETRHRQRSSPAEHTFWHQFDDDGPERLRFAAG